MSLYAVAEQHWPSIRARYYQIDLLDLPFTDFLTLIDGWLREVLSREDYEKFMMRMEARVVTSGREVSETVAEAEGEAFMSVMNLTQGG